MYDLNRFLSAQRRDYAAALREIRSGRSLVAVFGVSA